MGWEEARNHFDRLYGTQATDNVLTQSTSTLNTSPWGLYALAMYFLLSKVNTESTLRFNIFSAG
ncbi:hypothetical protein SAMN04487970_102570 [Paenibacillus tianmuensis]|uniref:Uncharacterized protein n=1 Tax=Paenibacillus tianmuensis TaxID=624147 RepID=A0A1G4SBR5_9BACL|nr:hypothetical protein SAMN04487970_102570 [Paenibacillus tianmuensis]